MALIEIVCFQCEKSLNFTDRIGIREECSHCGADVHVCRNCQHYDPSAYNECREPQAERVLEKDRSNRCDYFTPSSAKGKTRDAKQDLLQAAEALFKKSNS